MLQKLIKAIELEGKIFVPDSKQDLKLLTEQQKNAVAFNNLWQNLEHQENVKKAYKAACKIIEIGLALDEWYNGCDIKVNPSAYACLYRLKIIANKLHELNLQNLEFVAISERDYINFYQELINFVKPCMFYYINTTNINKNYTKEDYENLII